MKIGPVGAELFRAGGRTDMTKMLVAFRIFANALNKTDTCYLGYAVSDIWWHDQKTDYYIQGVPGGRDKTSGECSLC